MNIKTATAKVRAALSTDKRPTATAIATRADGATMTVTLKGKDAERIVVDAARKFMAGAE